MVPLKHIDYDLEIINSLAQIKITQNYFNPSDQFLDVDFSFPLDPNCSIYKFSAEFMEEKIEGVVKEKEEAKKEFELAKK